MEKKPLEGISSLAWVWISGRCLCWQGGVSAWWEAAGLAAIPLSESANGVALGKGAWEAGQGKAIKCKKEGAGFLPQL